ncbi:MAG: hypothetical protein KatS3mg031_1193 [Chitinophagales bacterium]|nr:MAG: hypothetical protein KatS3mg031_1193 [Chitinophagales bacterium]
MHCNDKSRTGCRRGDLYYLRMVRTLILSCILFALQGCSYYFGNTRISRFNYAPSALPSFCTRLPGLPLEQRVVLGKDLITEWADQSLGNWKQQGKVTEPRIMLAKLIQGKDIVAVNNYILQLQPWGRTGTRWLLNPKGDYDFTEVMWIAMVYLLEPYPEKLFPETVQHILEKLIISDGARHRQYAPRTLRLMRETENHILMKTASSYLKNKWLLTHSCTVNASRMFELEDRLLSLLDEMEKTGMYEFHSDPYFGYSMVPLLLLEAYGSEKIAVKARHVIDLFNFEYALGSLDFRYAGPFRRRLEKAGKSSIQDDPHSAMMRTWSFVYQRQPFTLHDIPHASHQALMALLLPYTLPDTIARFMQNRPDYFARISHGFRATPEIYSGGPGFLLSAGGVQRGKISQIVAQPTTLLLQDGAASLEECFHIKNKENMRRWNNTGVYRHFAAGKGKVHRPETYAPDTCASGWCIYKPYTQDALRVTVFNSADLGIILLFPHWQQGSAALLEEILKANPESKNLYHQFAFPDGQIIAYQLSAPKRLWVIEAINEIRTDRKHDFWKRLDIITHDNPEK